MKRIGLRWAAIGIAVALSAAGCSDDTASDTTASDVAEPTEADGDGATAGVDDGEGGESVGDLAIPLPPSADAVTSSESGAATIVQFIVPLEEQQATIAFYDDWTAAQADEYLRTEAETGGVSWQSDSEPGTDRNIIAVLSPLDGDDFVAVTLTTGIFE
ncbi:MAG: hypothetical protein ACR2QO_09335 [Acidimicrobiales bacterium]